ncbi:hypothetical protein [Azospirillum brasilense]|uniref:Uncharacterized protein n=1 Tax=Azospirillum brasilense TaxID=192 RepID=A0A6L3B2N3_AZOBR|nr:hypothetical protein [Azospirillum brasilense]KAA0686196.1 hypothetical protein DS837_10890 [Azospirillum brasilense]
MGIATIGHVKRAERALLRSSEAELDRLLAMPIAQRRQVPDAVLASLARSHRRRFLESLAEGGFTDGYRAAERQIRRQNAEGIGKAVVLGAQSAATWVDAQTRDDPILRSAVAGARWLGARVGRVARWAAPHAVRLAIWSAPLWAVPSVEWLLINNPAPRGGDALRWAWLAKTLAPAVVWSGLSWLERGGRAAARLPMTLCLGWMLMPLWSALPYEVGERLYPLWASGGGVEGVLRELDGYLLTATAITGICIGATVRAWTRSGHGDNDML